jgi:coenzyme Q-binding protein COQ10
VPKHHETRIVPYTADDMFAVVADVERYPEFLPWCGALTVLKREEEGAVRILTAEMAVAYHGLSERYVSRVRLDRCTRTIEAVHVEGPFKRLDTRWRFAPAGESSQVHFAIDFAFKSVVLSALAGVAFGLVARRMAEAFVKRADALYGSKLVEKQA